MNRRPFGKTGYSVSALGMGCMRLPRLYGENQSRAAVDLEKAFGMIRYAVEHGVDYFDTALTYHNRQSEAALGEALDGGLREKVRIATKQPTHVMKTKADIRRNLESTLIKLRTDYLDVYLIHNVNPSNWDEIKRRGIYAEYEKFRDEGMIRAVGFSFHGGPELFGEVLAEYPWDMCQVQMNLIDCDRETTAEAVTLAGQKGCALAVMEPLKGGGLANAPGPVESLYDAFPVRRAPVEWAFRYLLDYPQISTVLSGMTTLDQLKENIEIFSKPDAVPGCLSGGERELLGKVKAAYDSIGTVPCTGCGYCMPCPQGVDIPGAFTLYNDGMRFGDFGQPRRRYWFAAGAAADAGRCVACGECEKKCPQGIEVTERLKTAHKALEGWIE
ncbi:MAG: aldo/keto reductase [Firmicutes bacterium]|nr:aldo/keto reductase [Bacillota bacterium]